MRNKNSSNCPGKAIIGGIELKVTMSKVRNFAEITPNLPFSEFNFYELYLETFEKSELGRMKTQMSFPKLMEGLNGNIHFQMFCDILIDPTHPLTNYKLLDDIAAELAGSLKIQELQNLLAEAWKPYMKNLDTMFTDATCYESEMRYPTDQKLLWESVEKGYGLMCEASQRVGIHRPRTKYLDVEKTNLTYRKQRKHTKSQTRKITRHLLDLLLCPKRQACEGETGERLCETGTCASSRHSDGGIVRNAEGALLLASDQGQKEGDGDIVHLLRYPHREIRAMKPGPSAKMI